MAKNHPDEVGIQNDILKTEFRDNDTTDRHKLLQRVNKKLKEANSWPMTYTAMIDRINSAKIELGAVASRPSRWSKPVADFLTDLIRANKKIKPDHLYSAAFQRFGNEPNIILPEIKHIIQWKYKFLRDHKTD